MSAQHTTNPSVDLEAAIDRLGETAMNLKAINEALVKALVTARRACNHQEVAAVAIAEIDAALRLARGDAS